MKMSRFYEDNTCIKVYDIATKSVIATYDNYRRASDGLGVTMKVISKRTIKKERFFSPKMNKEVTCRIARKEVAA